MLWPRHPAERLRWLICFYIFMTLIPLRIHRFIVARQCGYPQKFPPHNPIVARRFFHVSPPRAKTRPGLTRALFLTNRMTHDRMLPFEQGRNAAKSDFGWCSLKTRIGIQSYTCAGCDYDPCSREAMDWYNGYRSYFREQNAKPRKRGVPMPTFKKP